MCCCGKPTINGELGYRWQPNDAPTTRGVNPPELGEGDELLFDEPGRCGGLDCHSHHFRVVKKWSTTYLMVRHGGGDERFALSCSAKLFDMAAMDSNQRYWLLYTIYDAHSDGAIAARSREREYWQKAAAEKRIKTRKMPARGSVKVWIEDAQKAGA